MRLALFLVLPSYAVVYGLSRHSPPGASIEELRGLETQPDIPQTLVPIRVRVNDCEETNAHVLEQRRGTEGAVFSPLSRSTNLPTSPPRTSIHSPFLSSIQGQPPSGTPPRANPAAKSHAPTVPRVIGNSAHGVAAPSASEAPRSTTTSRYTHVSGSKPPHVSPKVVIIVVCVLVVAVGVAAIFGLRLWRKKRSQREVLHQAVRPMDNTEGPENAWLGAA